MVSILGKKNSLKKIGVGQLLACSFQLNFKGEVLQNYKTAKYR